VNGKASVTYTAEAKSGFATSSTTCTVNATEVNGGASTGTLGNGANFTITQNEVPDSIALSANPSTIKGDGVSTSTLTATVIDGNTGVAVAGDTVNFAKTGGTCGMLSATSALTDTSGTASVTYTSALAPGTFCTITATETATNGSTTVTIIQTT
jgi:hypothetical protein